jgi:hypothetical protein
MKSVEHKGKACPLAAGSATLRHEDRNVIVSFMPRNLQRGYIGNTIFSIALAAVGIVFLWNSICRHDAPVWWVLPSALAGAGIYLLASTIQRGRRRTTVTAGASGLRVDTVGPFVASHRSWPRSRITSVHVSEYRSASVTIEERQISLDLDLSRTELRWLVTTVRSALGMAPQTHERIPLPADTRLICQKTGETARIVSPSERISLVVIAASLLLFIVLMIARLLGVCSDNDRGVALTMIALFVLGLLFVMLLWRNRTRTPTTFEFTRFELIATGPSLFRRRRYHWLAEQIEDVTAMGEQVFVWHRKGCTASSRTQRFMLGGSPQDCHWIAETIRHEMSLLADG